MPQAGAHRDAPPSGEVAQTDVSLPTPSAARTDSLAEGVAILMTLTVTQRGIGFVRAILFCRWLEPEQLGLWDLAFGFLLFAAPLAVLSLPGAFGRYAEHFRARGQLRAFLRSTIVVCAALALLFVTGLWFLRAQWAALIFGSPAEAPLLVATGVSLLAVIAYNYLNCLFTALRNVRLAAVLDFFSSVGFAVLGVSLLLVWRRDASSIVLAYGGAYAVCCLAAIPALIRLWRAEPTRAGSAQPQVWRKLLPFAGWVLVLNSLTNLFAFVDRAMIIHFAPGSSADTLALVGQYHSARVVPLLIVTISSLLATVLLPHLICDWEKGRRRRVSHRLNLFLKLMLLGMTAGSTCLLWIAPWLFRVALAGKYAAGEAVLGPTMVYCIWFGAGAVAQQYLWCAERAGRVCFALLAALATSITLNYLLLPQYGLHGVVTAAATANLLALAVVFFEGRRAGWHCGPDTWAWSLLPLGLYSGALVSTCVVVIVAATAWRGRRLLRHREKVRLVRVAHRILTRAQRAWPLRRFAAATK